MSFSFELTDPKPENCIRETRGTRGKLGQESWRGVMDDAQEGTCRSTLRSATNRFSRPTALSLRRTRGSVSASDMGRGWWGWRLEHCGIAAGKCSIRSYVLACGSWQERTCATAIDG